jgi:hypothetical protein
MSRGNLGPEDIATVPDVYRHNQELEEQLRRLRLDLEEQRDIAKLVYPILNFVILGLAKRKQHTIVFERRRIFTACTTSELCRRRTSLFLR